MGRKGYKGITAIGLNLYVVNDDGDHLIKMIQINPATGFCTIMTIAGQTGMVGNFDHDIGTMAFLARPGRIQADIINKRCYFGSRIFKNIRVLLLEGEYPVRTLNVDFHSILPGADLDFNRILITPSGEKMIVYDRKGPHILLISNLLSPNPILSLLHTAGSGIKTPLQAACFPICPRYERDNLWDADPHHISYDVEYRQTSHMNELEHKEYLDHEKGLPISVNHCFVAAGSRLWLVPLSQENQIQPPTDLIPQEFKEPPQHLVQHGENINQLPSTTPELKSINSTKSEATEHEAAGAGAGAGIGAVVEEEADEDQELAVDKKLVPYYQALSRLVSNYPCLLVCNVSSEYPKFLIHDMVALTSNTVLVLNRHSRRTGIWQLTAKDSWRYEKDDSVRNYYEIRYLGGKDLLGPHGMTLSLNRRHVIIVETGYKEESQHGGYFHMMSLHFSNRQQHVRGGNLFKLDVVEGKINDVDKEIKIAIDLLKGQMSPERNLDSHRTIYEQTYETNGEQIPDRNDEGHEVFDIFRPTKKQIGSCFGRK